MDIYIYIIIIIIIISRRQSTRGTVTWGLAVGLTTHPEISARYEILHRSSDLHRFCLFSIQSRHSTHFSPYGLLPPGFQIEMLCFIYFFISAIHVACPAHVQLVHLVTDSLRLYSGDRRQDTLVWLPVHSVFLYFRSWGRLGS